MWVERYDAKAPIPRFIMKDVVYIDDVYTVDVIACNKLVVRGKFVYQCTKHGNCYCVSCDGGIIKVCGEEKRMKRPPCKDFRDECSIILPAMLRILLEDITITDDEVTLAEAILYIDDKARNIALNIK